MANFNDAEITRLFVSPAAAQTVETHTPNAPGGGPFYITIELAAGNALQSEQYTLTWGCFDVTAGQPAPAVFTTSPGMPSSGQFGAAGWSNGTLYSTIEIPTQVNLAAGGGHNHIYQYSATLTTGNGQVASYASSDQFVLL